MHPVHVNLSILDFRTQEKTIFVECSAFRYAQAIVTAPMPGRFADILSQLIERRSLSAEQMQHVLREMIAGHYGAGEIAAFLVALRMKGETSEEIVAAAQVLRECMLRFETGRRGLLDTCGTGGDGAGTFNISTATALVAAGAGIPVVKHGNRAVSSRSGSADVLQALGLALDGDLGWARRCLETAGLAFCFAQRFHPAWSQVNSIRSQLGIATVFNCLGPLANPAGAEYQLLGVNRPELLDPLAEALSRLGTRHALVVYGEDGLDEITLGARTHIREVRDEAVTSLEWNPSDFGLGSCSARDLHVAGPDQSAARIRDILDGSDSPSANVVLANAAAALFTADQVDTPRAGVAKAAQAIASGKAREVLDKLILCSQQWARETKLI
jgi:anthranilate phosphoribosyltransferase